MIVSEIYNNFASGELSPNVWGRTDRPFYKSGLEVMRNWIPLLTGGMKFRPGFGYSVHTRLNRVATLLSFRFNVSQAYTLEFTDYKMRVHKDGGVVLETAKNVTGATNASPGVITSAAHGFANGDEVYFLSVGGMTELNGKFFLVAGKTTDTFQLTDIDGTAINTTSFGAYTSGGTVARVYEIASPYAAADISGVNIAGTADIAYLVHPSYAPYKLTRSGHASWTLATYSRTNDPFTGAGKYPGAVGFFGGRLWMGGTDDDPDIFYGSRGPNASTGASQYDDFTTGTAATDAIIFTLTSQNLTADRIYWFSGTPGFLVIGTSGGVYKANGGLDGAAITPSAISVTPVSSVGTQDLMPFRVGNQTVYVEQGGLTLRSFGHDFIQDTYISFDKSILADEITTGGVTQIAFSKGRPEMVWAVRADGVLLSCTLLEKEEVAGWARHYLGGDGKVLSICTESKTTGFDRVGVCVERTIDGHTRRYIEYLSEDPILPDIADNYTGEGEHDDDLSEWEKLVFESQKQFVRLDCAATLDTVQSVTLTLGALSGNGVMATAGSSVFAATDIGKFICVKYLDGTETGLAEIVGYTSGTVVSVNIKEVFSALTFASGGWYLMAQTVRGLDFLEGETVSVLADGAVHPDCTVADGVIALDFPARYVIVGKRYVGITRLPAMDFGSQAGSSQARIRSVVKLFFKLRDAMGGKYGEMYDLQELVYRKVGASYFDRPPVLFSGLKQATYSDKWANEKRLCVVQDAPLPITVLAIIPAVDVGEEE